MKTQKCSATTVKQETKPLTFAECTKEGVYRYREKSAYANLWRAKNYMILAIHSSTIFAADFAVDTGTFTPITAGTWAEYEFEYVEGAVVCMEVELP